MSLYINVNINGEVIECSYIKNIGHVIPDDSFNVYPAPCFTYDSVTGVLVLKTDFQTVLDGITSNALLAELEPLKLAKCKEVDTNTANSITALAGSLESQSNKQAKASQLIRKEALGTITAIEATTLAYLDDLFLQIEILVATGNAKEAEIMACTTLATFEAVVI